MPKTAYLHTRLEPELKAKAEEVFQKLGVSPSEAVTMFYSQVVLHEGFPFPLRIPNEETLAALKEDAAALPGYTSSKQMMQDILKETD